MKCDILGILLGLMFIIPTCAGLWTSPESGLGWGLPESEMLRDGLVLRLRGKRPGRRQKQASKRT